MEGGALEQAVAVLPVAAVEQHGPHLPLGVDVQIMEHALAAVLRALPETAPVVLLPVQAVGVSPEHGAFAGTLTLPAILAAQVWTAIAEGVAAAGCRRLVLLSSHGGNMPTLDIVAQDLRARLGMVCVTTAFARFGLPPGLAEAGHDWHGGLAETAVMRGDGTRLCAAARHPARRFCLDGAGSPPGRRDRRRIARHGSARRGDHGASGGGGRRASRGRGPVHPVAASGREATLVRRFSKRRASCPSS